MTLRAFPAAASHPPDYPLTPASVPPGPGAACAAALRGFRGVSENHLRTERPKREGSLNPSAHATSQSAIADKWILLAGGTGDVLGIAGRDAGGNGWQPYLVASVRRQRLRIKAASGEMLDCRISTLPPH